MGEEAKVRAASIRLATESLRSRREKTSLRCDADLLIRRRSGSEYEADKLEEVLSEADDENDGLLFRIPRLIEQKATDTAVEACDVHREIEGMRRRICGYTRQFESGDMGMVGPTGGPEVSVMEQ